MKTIKGDTKDVKLKALGENRWDQSGRESILDHDNQSNEWTLDEIKNMLTKSEKKLLLDPFHDSFWYNYCQKRWFFMSRKEKFISFQNLEGSIEDANRLQHFFSMQHSRLDELREELYYFTCEEGILKLADKYLGQKVQNVGGNYMVPVTLAPILETLLGKYGDLQGDQHLLPAMRNIGATLLCIVINRMCKTKVEDITWGELKHYNFDMRAIKEITGFNVGRYLDDTFPLEAFLGFEAIRYETKVREEHDNRIAELKMELERWEDSREKLKTYASKMSDVMEECSGEASKWKHRYMGDKWF